VAYGLSSVRLFLVHYYRDIFFLRARAKATACRPSFHLFRFMHKTIDVNILSSRVGWRPSTSTCCPRGLSRRQLTSTLLAGRRGDNRHQHVALAGRRGDNRHHHLFSRAVEKTIDINIVGGSRSIQTRRCQQTPCCGVGKMVFRVITNFIGQWDGVGGQAFGFVFAFTGRICARGIAGRVWTGIIFTERGTDQVLSTSPGGQDITSRFGTESRT
jgi:hypothetical protein